MRIDPLKKDGTIDVKFFGSDEYSVYLERLKWYLKQEGFSHIDKQMIIRFLNHDWLIQPATYKPKH